MKVWVVFGRKGLQVWIQLCKEAGTCDGVRWMMENAGYVVAVFAEEVI